MTTALWLLLWLLTPQAITSNSISGTVVRAQTDQPLVNEQVGLWPTSETALTGSLGEFTFSKVPPGEYALVVVHDRIRVRVSRSQKFPHNVYEQVERQIEHDRYQQ